MREARYESFFGRSLNLTIAGGYCVFHYNNCASRATTTQALRSQNGSTRFCVCGQKRASEHRTTETSLSPSLDIEQCMRREPAYRICVKLRGRRCMRRGPARGHCTSLRGQPEAKVEAIGNRTSMRRRKLSTATRSALEIATRTHTPFSVYARSCRPQKIPRVM